MLGINLRKTWEIRKFTFGGCHMENVTHICVKMVDRLQRAEKRPKNKTIYYKYWPFLKKYLLAASLLDAVSCWVNNSTLMSGISEEIEIKLYIIFCFLSEPGMDLDQSMLGKFMK